MNWGNEPNTQGLLSYFLLGNKLASHVCCRYGFFNNKRIVLFDTLVEQCSETQVVAVLAHELGKQFFHTPLGSA